MKKVLTATFVSLMFTAFAQQDPQFTQNMFNKLLTNPGYAGTSHAFCATALYRNQWSSFEGAPKTGLVSLDAYIPQLRGGLGLTIMTDKLGFEKSNYAKLAYSYHLPIGPGILGIGAEAGMLNKSINGTWITPDGETSAGGITDKKIPTKVSTTVLDLGLGLYYTTQRIWMGLSSTHLSKKELTDLNYIVARTYYFTAGGNFDLNKTWELKPSVFVKSVASPTQLDINCIAQWNRRFYGGLTYRVTDAVALLVGFNKELPNGSNLRIGYSYDYTTSALNLAMAKGGSQGSHEIMLNYCFNIEPPIVKEYHENVRNMNHR